MNKRPFKSALFACTLLSGLSIVACASEPSQNAAVDMAAPSAEVAKESSGENFETVADTSEAQSTTPQRPSQLIKTAHLDLVVNSISETLPKVSEVAKQQQGDIFSLQNQQPKNRGSRHSASITLRVPQSKLETTLQALSQLGTVQRQNISAEDVSNQLVDSQARLRSLRQAENTLLKIMERSGSVGDVLKVAQELKNTRVQIEQIDAQLKDLRDRVAFSTVTLNLEAATISLPPEQALGLQLSQTWKSASYSVESFTTNLLKIGIWLLTYSPYLAILTVAIWLSSARLRKSSTPLVSESRETESNG
ncbi:DUF4349 domain-containing protein [Lusitaniella coriacea]|uniref:DUF4349 domain-containing protein n=1 Tax=Lusitaniella coriacea TaxID=1983105 RepID=UPI003CF32BB2